MPPKTYNFFGQSPGQMDASQSPKMLAQAMALQEFNNPTSAQASSISSAPSIDPKALAAMLKSTGNSDISVPSTGSGLTSQFGQGVLNPNASTATGSGLTQQFGNPLMSAPTQSPYNINGVWNG